MKFVCSFSRAATKPKSCDDIYTRRSSERLQLTILSRFLMNCVFQRTFALCHIISIHQGFFRSKILIRRSQQVVLRCQPSVLAFMGWVFMVRENLKFNYTNFVVTLVNFTIQTISLIKQSFTIFLGADLDSKLVCSLSFLFYGHIRKH